MDNCDKRSMSQFILVHKDKIYYCDKCGFLVARREKLRSHMEALHKDGDFNVTSVISQQHKRGNLGVIKKILKDLIYYCDKCVFLAARRN